MLITKETVQEGLKPTLVTSSAGEELDLPGDIAAGESA